jgi:hypothetical protein
VQFKEATTDTGAGNSRSLAAMTLAVFDESWRAAMAARTGGAP